jgi:hypothetical protein
MAGKLHKNDLDVVYKDTEYPTINVDVRETCICCLTEPQIYIKLNDGEDAMVEGKIVNIDSKMFVLATSVVVLRKD